MGKSKELAELGDVVTQNGGNVGIGTSSPVAKLQIRTQTDANAAFQNSTSVSGGVKINAFTDAANASVPFELDGSSLQFNTVAVERMRIDASGRVTMPYQPSFNIYQSGPWSLTAGVWGQNVNLDTARHNVGNHFNTSNGSFTAPISGKYLLTYISHFNSSTPSYFYSGIQINGGFEVYLFGYNAAVSGGDNTFGGSTILHINANDVVTFWNYDGDGGTIGHGYQRTHASGHLIG